METNQLKCIMLNRRCSQLSPMYDHESPWYVQIPVEIRGRADESPIIDMGPGVPIDLVHGVFIPNPHELSAQLQFRTLLRLQWTVAV